MLRALLLVALAGALANAEIVRMNRAWKPYTRGVQPYEDPNLRVPDAWDWRNVNGTRYTTAMRNQHAPATDPNAYCGSCWAMSTATMLQTRWAIMNRGRAAENIMLSVQEAINCGGAGSCDGGDSYGLLDYWKKNGAVPEDCSPYLAINGECNTSPMTSRCYTCNRGVGCKSIDRYHKYFVDQMGSVTGEEQMKAEIYARGPIVASIHDPPSLKAWNATSPDDVYEDPSGETMPTHNVALVGYGTNSKGVPYWVIENSWGTAWNYVQYGYVLVVRGKNNLGIEGNGCMWGTLRDSS
jgi:cathepsin X